MRDVHTQTQEELSISAWHIGSCSKSQVPGVLDFFWALVLTWVVFQHILSFEIILDHSFFV